MMWHMGRMSGESTIDGACVVRAGKADPQQEPQQCIHGAYALQQHPRWQRAVDLDRARAGAAVTRSEGWSKAPTSIM